MGFELVYCYKCQTRLTETMFQEGQALRIGTYTSCLNCADELLSKLTPEQRKTVFAHSKLTVSTKKLEPTRAEKPATPHAAAHPPPADEQQPPAPSKILIGVLIGCIAVVLILVVVALGGRGKGDGTGKSAAPTAAGAGTAGGGPSAASDPQREAAAKAALQKAHDFAQSNPDDFIGQIRHYEQAEAISERTPLAEEARRDKAAAQKKADGLFGPAVKALEDEIRGPLERREYQGVLDALNAARSRHALPGWADAVNRKSMDTQKAADEKFAQLRPQAELAYRSNDAAGIKRCRDEVATWGIPKYAETLEQILRGAAPAAAAAAGTAPPAAPPARPGLRLYGDALVGGCQNWSWKSSVSLDNADPVFEGSRSILFRPAEAWAGLYLHVASPFPASDAGALSFAIRAAQPGGTCTVALYDAKKAVGHQVKLSDCGGEPVPGEWKRYEIKLSDFGVSGTQSIQGFALQAAPAGAIFYVDDVVFVASGGDAPAAGGTEPPAAAQGGEHGPFELDDSGFVRNWILAGPFPNPNRTGLRFDFLRGEAAYEPELGRDVDAPDGTRSRWSAYASPGYKIALHTLPQLAGRSDYAVAYAACWLESEEEKDVEIRVGSDDGNRLWVNHRRVGEATQPRECKLDEDRYPLKLTRGRNLVLIKAENTKEEFEFMLRIVTPGGDRVSGVKVWN